MRPSHLGYAVLFSVPMGVGVALAVYQMSGDFPLNPLALGSGLVVTVGIFLLVLAGVRPGPDADGGPE